MDKGSFREIDMEYDFKTQDTRTGEINQALIIGALRSELRPWPLPFPARMWVDNTPRYFGDVGGPQIKTHHQDMLSPGLYDEVPATLARIENESFPEVNFEDGRISTEPDVEAIQDRNPHPTEWLRLDLENETAGVSDLREQIVMMQQTDKTGGKVAVVGDYNPIFAPFDLRHPEWYHVMNSDGEVIATDPTDVAKLTAVSPEGFYRLYLRPANWRWVVTVVAHYIYISWFEAFPTDEIFTIAYYQRPPIYPKRHDVLNAIPVFEINHALHCYDPAIEASWEMSRAEKELAFWIIDAQWYTMSEVYIFVGNDPASCAITMYPPHAGDVVLGIGRVDYPGGAEEVLWLKQVVAGDAAPGWTPTLIEFFFLPWYVTPQPPGL
jgi:hypothetical protein